MADPIFLTVEDVVEFHAEQIKLYGGDANILDMEKLESAVAMARQAFGEQYVHEGLHGMAAAYLFHITQIHAFADGNKRTGLYSALTFLAVNGRRAYADPDVLEALVVKMVTGVISEGDVAEFFKKLIEE